ncbi:MAG: class I SAM-dependent methyltransferase, partial [Deltaproteobacteria bacterium]|nr:class I SAM-dependent methyltransferase [Deltaproteobacteria bacterium]
MQRIAEPELMLDKEQARAYAEADFDEPHSMFIDLFRERFRERECEGYVLDLGCGPGDITFRFARAYPCC